MIWENLHEPGNWLCCVVGSKGILHFGPKTSVFELVTIKDDSNTYVNKGFYIWTLQSQQYC